MEKNLNRIASKVGNKERISRSDARFLFTEASDQLLSELATAAKKRVHAGDVAT